MGVNGNLMGIFIGGHDNSSRNIDDMGGLR